MRRRVYFVMSIAILSAAALMASRTADTAQAANQDSAAPYTVQDGDKVDPKTLDGWKTWRAMACERCHGAEQEGLVGPALVNSLKVLTKDQFHTTVTQGRLERACPTSVVSSCAGQLGKPVRLLERALRRQYRARPSVSHG